MRFLNGRLSVNPTAFYIDINNLQAVVTAGTCSSRLVFNVPKARSVGGELEVKYAPTNNFDFSVSGSYNDSEVRESLNGTESAISATGIREGNRLPSVPKFQMALSATYQHPITPTWWGYVTASYNHVGDRYTQLVDQEAGVGVIALQGPGALPNTIGGPLTQNTFVFDPLLPSYDLVNLRLGIRHGVWDVAFYVNNITNETAFLSLDRERGFLAREGFLVNQPRTFGIASRFDF
jgi:iron complex outermembrane receptor protein